MIPPFRPHRGHQSQTQKNIVIISKCTLFYDAVTVGDFFFFFFSFNYQNYFFAVLKMYYSLIHFSFQLGRFWNIIEQCRLKGKERRSYAQSICSQFILGLNSFEANLRTSETHVRLHFSLKKDRLRQTIKSD